MKKIIAYLLVLFSFASCDLNKLEPAQEKAFMKYFGDVGNTTAVDLLKLSDGYLLLGNNLSAGIINSVIIKVDKAGNTLWTSPISDFIGKSLAQSTDGYFIIGDRIDGTNPTSMRLYKMVGTDTSSTDLGDPIESYHGAALTVTGSGDIIVSGTIDNSTTSNQIFLYGYDASLTPNWTMVRKYGSTNDGITIKTSKSIFIDQLGNIRWSELRNQNGSISLVSRGAPSDRESTTIDEPLFQGKTLVEEVGDINGTYNSNVAAVQSIASTSGVTLGVYLFSSGADANSSFELLAPENSNLRAGSVSTTDRAFEDEFLIVGSTDYHPEEGTRNDTDFYISKIAFNGEILFESSFGGTGDESAVAVVPADDGGYIMLGTLRNTNEVSLMVLAKVNNNGELIN